MDYTLPDDAEGWLRANDPEFGKGENPYLSQWQLDHRCKKETPVNPHVIDNVDFSVTRSGNYGTKNQIPAFQKDRHRRGQRDTESP